MPPILALSPPKKYSNDTKKSQRKFDLKYFPLSCIYRYEKKLFEKSELFIFSVNIFPFKSFVRS